ncbi:MAG: hypothetical protein J6Q84_05435 [Kiritimatiellae bacterium]|nr:hypothetical protein [Kiritimatiellia bacterium]
MLGKRSIIALLVPVILAIACGLVLFINPIDFKTSLYDVVGPKADALPVAVRVHSSRLVPIMVSSKDASLARDVADSVAKLLPTNYCKSIRYKFDSSTLSDLLSMYRARGAGLVSPRDEELLKTVEGRERIARAAVRRYYSSPIPPLFSPSDDPFCLLDSFVTSLPVSFSGWSALDGVLTARRDDITYVLILVELYSYVAEDTDKVIEFKDVLDDIFTLVHNPKVEINPCGVPLHTAITASKCKNEIDWLTWFSLGFIAILSVIVFRSVKWLPFLLASLVVSALAGIIVLAIAFPFIHMVTIVFGTTILGLVIDYSFHWLLQDSSVLRQTKRNLLISFLTTEISLLPLMLSSLPVLRQSAVFLGVGLLVALLYVLFCYPSPVVSLAKSRFGVIKMPLSFVILGVILIVSVVGLCGVTFKTDPMSIYKPPKILAESERVFSELSGTQGEERGFYVISEGDSLEELLSREAKLDLSIETPRLSRFLPPLENRIKNYENIEKLYKEHALRQSERLGVSSLALKSLPQPWTWGDVPSSAEAFVGDKSLRIPSALAPKNALPEGVRFYAPRIILSEILTSLADEARLRLLISLGVMFIALIVFCRYRAFAIIFPSIIALLSVIGFLGLLGENVTLFHLLACFLLIGMGVDYTVFLHSGVSHALKPALASLLTSVAGFGALLFVSFPVVNAFGFVLAIGLPIAFFSALVTAPSNKSETEYGASPIGLEILYFVYCVFVLRFLHFLAKCAGLSIWLSSRSVRRASPSWKKLVQFTQSLADKLVVMADSRRLPTVELEDSKEARQFIDDVASRKGVFVLSSHCGTIEVLAALGSCEAIFHAWMEFERTSVFNKFYLRHAKRKKVVIHPISSFGPETVFMAGDALDDGDCLVMAGDRGFGRKRKVKFGLGEIELSEGAFRFARALTHPVYFVACVSVGACKYKAIIRRLSTENLDLMCNEYANILYEVTSAYPDQWFKWEGA